MVGCHVTDICFLGFLALTDSSVRLYAPELRKPKSEYKVRLPWLNRVLYLVI